MPEWKVMLLIVTESREGVGGKPRSLVLSLFRSEIQQGIQELRLRWKYGSELRRDSNWGCDYRVSLKLVK